MLVSSCKNVQTTDKQSTLTEMTITFLCSWRSESLKNAIIKKSVVMNNHRVIESMYQNQKSNLKYKSSGHLCDILLASFSTTD